MGHSSARAALVYQHATKHRERAIGAAISARIEAARAQEKRHDRDTAAGSDPDREPAPSGEGAADPGPGRLERVTGIEPA